MSLLFSQLRIFFPHVTIAKPRSSRNSSIEVRKKLRNENVIRGKAKNLTENILLCEYILKLCDQPILVRGTIKIFLILIILIYRLFTIEKGKS